MGKRGPAPTPTKILKMRGSTRLHDNKSGRKGKTEPEPTAGKQDKEVKLTRRQSAIVRRIQKHLEDMQILARTDGNAVARYAIALTRYDEVNQRIEKDGLIVNGKRTPDSRVIFELDALLLRLEREFGLTPSARSQIHVEKPKEGSFQDAFIA